MSTVDSVRAKAKEVAVEDFNKAKAVAISAGKSGAYLYPIKVHIFASKYLENAEPSREYTIFCGTGHYGKFHGWTAIECADYTVRKPLLSKLVPTMSLSVAVVAFMFFFAYLPQLAVLVFVNGPLAAFTTALLTLSESSTLITLISKIFLIQDALVDTFDGVLVAKNETAILSEGRQLKSGSDPINKLGKLLKSPFEKFTPKALIRYVMYLPLNFIPVVGTAIFIFIQGRSRGNSAHTRYFQLKKWSSSQREAFLKENVGPYTSFGIVATLLELVPIASIFFSFTNTVGAALWAADMEKNGASMTNTTAPNLREAAKKSQ